MSDVFTQAKRSEVMSRIRGKGNKSTELKLLALFRQHKVTGWRRHQPLPGKPDFAFPRVKLAVFVDGCFWHGCPECYVRPKSNQEYWDKKHRSNKDRDRRVDEKLRDMDWTPMRIWEHSLKDIRSARIQVLSRL